MAVKKYNQNAVIRGALRRAFARSPLVQEIMSESRREVPRYKKDGTRHKKNAVQRQCQLCLEWVSSSKISVDHIEPVIPVNGHSIMEDGSQDWNEFVDRLWCTKSGKSNLQRVCDSCHNQKTYKERIDRLSIKYLAELEKIETDLVSNKTKYSEIKKQITKFLSKKKIVGFEFVVQKAQAIKNNFDDNRRQHVKYELC